MKKPTISDAIVTVLKKADKPLSLNEVFDLIVKNNIYNFKSANPINIVSTEIRRHCEGNPQSSKRAIYFVKTKDGKYWLSEKQPKATKQ